MRKYATLDDLRFFQREVERRCRERNITVRFVDNIPTAYADENGIYIPSPVLPMSYEDFMLLRYYVLHELGHHLRAEAFALLESMHGQITPDQFGVWNAVEDELQEDVTRREWAGDRRTLVLGRELHIKGYLSVCAQQKASIGGVDADEDSCKRVAAHCIAQTMRKGWHPAIMHRIDETLALFGARARALYEELLSEGWDKRMVPMSVEDGLHLSLSLAERLWPSQQQPQPQPQKPNAQEQQGEGEGSDGDPGPEGAEAQQNDAQESPQNQGDTGDEAPEAQQNQPSSQELSDGEGEPTQGPSDDSPWTVPWEQILQDNHEEKTSKGSPRGSMTINYAGHRIKGVGSFFPDSEIRIQPNGQFETDRNPRESMVGMQHRPDRGFPNQVRRYIQSKQHFGWESNKLSGRRINRKALKRLATGTKERNRRVFQTRDEVTAPNTCITVLVDWSGSMHGSRATMAANAAATLVDTFERVLRIPVEVLAHTTMGSPLIYEVKKYGERLEGRDIVARLAPCYMGANADGDALMVAYERIRVRNERRKIIISICDGQPVKRFRTNDDPANILKYAVDHIRSKGVELYGIGIETESVRRFYGDNSKVVTHDAELSRVLLDAAKQFTVSS